MEHITTWLQLQLPLFRCRQTPVVVKKLCLQIVERFQNVPQNKNVETINNPSPTVHNIIKKNSLNARDTNENQYWMPVIFGPLRHHCIKSRILTLEITAWARGHLQKSLSLNTVLCAVYKCKLQLYFAKKKPYVYTVQKCCRPLWANDHFKWTKAKWETVLWKEISKIEILFGNHEHHILQLKEKRDHLAYQRVQKPAYLMVQGCISATCTRGKMTPFFREGLAYFSKVLNCSLHLLQLHGFEIEESGWWTDRPPIQIFHQLKPFGAS